MLDSVSLWLSRESVSNTDLLAEIPCLLSEITEHVKDDQVYISGHIENLRVNVNYSGVSIKGSLAKYFLKDNFNTLQRQDIQRAIEQLADFIHLPISDAKVTRADIAQNYIVNYSPESYYTYLGDCQYFKRMVQPQSIYYSNQNRTKLFYNKIAEGKKKRYEIPDVWLDCNVLRYEYRLTGRVAQSLKKDEVRAKDLFDESVYIYLIDEYIKEYENITKNSLINFNLENMNSPKDFFKQIALLKIQEIGQNEVMKLVEDMRAKQVFDKKEYYSRLKSDIKKLCQIPESTESTELITELNQKIMGLKSNYR